MTTKSQRKKEARTLQKETGWDYVRCLVLVDMKTPAEIREMVAEEKAKRATKK